MNIWASIKALDFSESFQLGIVLMRHPLYILPTLKATKETLKICDELFGEAHHENNKTNAFRHALWNFLIAEKCFRGNNSVKDSLAWAEKITNLHEKLSPNKKLPKLMDLHNNRIGRNLFLQQVPSEEIIKRLQEKMKQAVKISTEKEANANPHQLIYIEK